MADAAEPDAGDGRASGRNGARRRSATIGRPREGPALAGLSDSRAEVYQAVGMISVQLGVGLEVAFVRLRAHAFADGRALEDVADDVVTRVLRFSPDPSPDPRPGHSTEPQP